MTKRRLPAGRVFRLFQSGLSIVEISLALGAFCDHVEAALRSHINRRKREGRA